MGYKDKKCGYCDKMYTPKSGRSSFCTPECAYNAKRIKLLKWRDDNPEVYKNACEQYNKNRDTKNVKNNKRVLKFETLICEICKNKFKPTSAGSKYCSKKCKLYVENESRKKKRAKNPQIFREKDKKHYYNNLVHTRKTRNKNSFIRRQNNPSVRIADNLRTRLRNTIKYKAEKHTSVINLIGCTVDELIQHLESLFTKGMTWEKYGLYGWHIDHIKPCIAFNLETIEEQQKCFHYSNLQPLWAEDNLSKGGKYNED